MRMEDYPIPLNAVILSEGRSPQSKNLRPEFHTEAVEMRSFDLRFARRSG